jgi:hypothetical protein
MNFSSIVVTVATLIFAVTSMITVFISLSAWKEEQASARPYLIVSNPKVAADDRELFLPFIYATWEQTRPLMSTARQSFGLLPEQRSGLQRPRLPGSYLSKNMVKKLEIKVTAPNQRQAN